MNGYECFKLYLPLKLHFTREAFSIFDTPRVKNSGVDNYNKRKDKQIFEKLGRQFKEPRECVRYYVSNFAYGHQNFLYEPGQALDNFKLWNKRIQSMTNMFSTDCDYILHKVETGEMKLTNDMYGLFDLYMSGKIAHETLVILNKYMKIFDLWNTKEFRLIWENEYLRLTKSERFIKFDENKINKIYHDYDTNIKNCCVVK